MTAPRRTIGLLTGDPKETSVKFLVASFTDPATTAITVEIFDNEARSGSPIDSVSVTVGAKYADDRGSNDPAGETWVCWVASDTLTGLTAGTRYYLRATQGSNTEDFATWTAPAAGDDFDLWCVSCDKSYRFVTDSADYRPPTGAWAFIRELAEDSVRPQFCVFTDDVGYADNARLSVLSPDESINDATTGKAQTGRAVNTALAYDYGCTYIAMLGMFEDDDIPAVAWGRDDDRHWCLSNMPFTFQWGDHDVQDNIGASATAAQALAAFAPALDAWVNLFGLLNPTPAINLLDSGTLAWALVLGDLKVLCPDCVTNLSGGDFTSYPYAVTACLGADQIDDILNAAATAEPFKLLVFPYFQGRMWKDDPLPTGTTFDASFNANQPLAQWLPDEWTQLFHAEGNTPKSLMESATTNGADGVLIVAHGDLHDPQVQRFYGWDGDTGFTGSGLRSDWVSYIFATCNRNRRTSDPESITAMQGRYHRGMELQSHGSFLPTSGADSGVYEPACLHIAVSGSASPKSLTARLLVGRAENPAQGVPTFPCVFRPGSNRPRNRMMADRSFSP